MKENMAAIFLIVLLLCSYQCIGSRIFSNWKKVPSRTTRCYFFPSLEKIQKGYGLSEKMCSKTCASLLDVQGS